MTTSEIVQLVLAGLVVLNLVVLCACVLLAKGQIEIKLAELDRKFASLQEETIVTLQQAHDTLARVEALSKSVDVLVKDQISPTLELVRATVEHAEATARAVRGSAEGARRVIGAVEGMTSPASAAAMAGKLIGSPSGRLSAAVVVGGALVKALMSSHSRAPRKSARSGGEV